MLWALGPVMISFTLSSEAPVLKHRVCTVSIVILHVSLRSPTSAASTLFVHWACSHGCRCCDAR